MQPKTRQLALCSLFCALAVVLLSMGGVIPFALFCAPILASLLLIPVMAECSPRYAWTWFFATALLALMVAPEKETVSLFCFLGYYPLLQPKLQALPSRLLRVVTKLLFVSLAVAADYALLLFVFQLQSVVEEFKATGTALLLLTLLMGLVLFFLYDRIVWNFRLLYRRKRKKK